MEIELVGGQAGEVRVLDKALALGAVIVLDEVGEGSVTEAEGDPLPLHVLLPHAGYHLREGGRCGN